MSRRLPVYLLLDTSGSMAGEPIQQVNSGVQMFINGLLNDPYALETVHVSIISFNRSATVVCPLTSICDIKVPQIQCPPSGPSHLGAAIEFLLQRLQKEVVQNSPVRKGDYRPLLLIMTGGGPSDTADFERIIPVVKAVRFRSLWVWTVGSRTKSSLLQKLAGENVIDLSAENLCRFLSSFWRSEVEAPLDEEDDASSCAASSFPLPAEPLGIQIVA